MDILEGKCDFNDVPNEHRSYAVCLAQLARHGYDITYLPNENRSAELYLVAVRCSPATVALRWIPSEILTYDICFEGVKRSGENLQYVPEKYRDAEMCLLAVKKPGEILHLVPHEHRTLQLCKIAAFAGQKLKHVPDQFKEEVYAYVCSIYQYGILQIPANERTKEHYLLAYNNGFSIECIPEDMRPNF